MALGSHGNRGHPMSLPLDIALADPRVPLGRGGCLALTTRKTGTGATGGELDVLGSSLEVVPLFLEGEMFGWTKVRL